MKVIVQQETLSKLLAKGGISALTDEAQGDSTSLAPLIQSVKITADENFTIESAVKTIIVKCSIPATIENGVEVKESGEAVVLAKDIVSWVNNQTESKIGLSLSKLEVPESVASKSDDMEVKSSDVVKKIGTLKITSKDNSKTGSKWSLDAYDPKQLPKARVGNKLDKLFDIEPKNLKVIMDYVVPSAQKSDFEHVYDSMVIQKTKDGIHAGATDTKRCNVYRMDKLIENVGSFFDTEGAKLLIPIKTLVATIKAADEGTKMSFEYDSERHSVLITQDGFSSRVAIPDKNVFSKFPSLDKLLEKKYKDLCTFTKNVMVSRLVTSSIVNPESALFNFANNEVKIYVASDGGKSPNTSTCPVSGLSEEYSVVCGVQHLLDIAKIIKDKELVIMVPDGDKRSYKIVSKEDPNVVFVAMSPANPKYDNVVIE